MEKHSKSSLWLYHCTTTVPLYFDTRHVNWMHSNGQFMCSVCLILQPQKCIIHINGLQKEYYKWRKLARICKNMRMMERHKFPHTALLYHIPWKHLVALPELNCFSTQFTLTFCLFAVTKGGAQQTVPQHGEGRHEGPQQRGRGGDGMPLCNFTSAPLCQFVLSNLSDCSPFSPSTL